MRFEIVLAPRAVEAFRALSATQRAELRQALVETHLRHQSTQMSRSRIKRLRGMVKPQFRLRVGDIRVFHDVTNETFEVPAIIAKSQAQQWLEEEGTPEPDGSSGQGEG